MTQMAQIDRIRHLILVEGCSQRSVSRALHVSRKTIVKALTSTEIPRYHGVVPRPKPIIGAFEAIIASLLEREKGWPPKQRLTARRIFEILRDDYDYHGSEPTVRRAVAAQRLKHKEVFIPLEFAPGEAAQADFGEAQAVIGGETKTVYVLCMRLCHSKALFVQAFPNARQEALLEGLRRGFAFLGGVPARLILDNLKPAVQKILSGKERLLQDNFLSFKTHYLLGVDFCTPAKGNEKGLVENLVGFSRRSYLVPVPEVPSFEALNDQRRRSLHGEAWKVECASLRPLPEKDFACCRTVQARVDKTSRVCFETNRYSVPTVLAYRSVELRAYIDRVEVWSEGRQVAMHRRLYGRGQEVYDLEHYLPLLRRKPGALRNAKPFQRTDLPASYRIFLHELCIRHTEGTREFLQILEWDRELGRERVSQAVEQACASHTFNLGAVRALLSISPDVHVDRVDPRDFNRLLKGGVIRE